MEKSSRQFTPDSNLSSEMGEVMWHKRNLYLKSFTKFGNEGEVRTINAPLKLSKNLE